MHVALVGTSKRLDVDGALVTSNYYVTKVVSGDHDPIVAVELTRKRCVPFVWVKSKGRSHGEQVVRCLDALVVS